MGPIHLTSSKFKEMRAVCIEDYDFIPPPAHKMENNLILKLDENLSSQKGFLNVGLVQKTDDRSFNKFGDFSPKAAPCWNFTSKEKSPQTPGPLNYLYVAHRK